VPVNDSDSLAEAIARVSSDEGLRASLGRNAMRTVTESYTWTHYGQRVAECLQEAVGITR
jgi:glycosyltransferase involved in cell wall biosynthesis